MLYILESNVLIIVNSFIAHGRFPKVPFQAGTLFVSTNSMEYSKDDSRGTTPNNNLKQLITKLAQTEQDLEQRLMKLARTEQDLLAQIAVKERALEQQQAQINTKSTSKMNGFTSSKDTNGRMYSPLGKTKASSTSKMSSSRPDDLDSTGTTIDIPLGSTSFKRSTATTKSMKEDASSNKKKRMSASLDFSDDIRKSIITGYFVYALGLGSTLALQTAIQTYPEEWASFVTKTQTRVESATMPITTATATLQELIEEAASSASSGVSSTVESTTNAVLEKLRTGASIIENTRTRLESIKTTTEGAVDNAEAAANTALEKMKNGLTIIGSGTMQVKPSGSDNAVTNENVMMNAEVSLDTTSTASIIDESGSTNKNIADDVKEVVVTNNEITFDDLATDLKNVEPAEINPNSQDLESTGGVTKGESAVSPLTNSLSETNLMEESAVKTQSGDISILAPDEPTTNFALQEDNAQLGETASTISTTTTTDILEKENAEEFVIDSTLDTSYGAAASVAESPISIESTTFDTQPSAVTSNPEGVLREAAVNTFLEALLSGEISIESAAKVESAIDLYLQQMKQ